MNKTSTKITSLILVLTILILSLTGCGASGDPRVTVEGTKFMVNGKELWLSGVNTPWFKWNDFTGEMDEEIWEKTFAQLAEDNINCTRIWLNCDGSTIVSLTGGGKFKSVNEGHWTDLDKLFALAEKYGVYVMATLLSFDHFKTEKWQKMLASKEYVDMYAEGYVKEFCQRYGDNPYLFSIDLMNEPDWVYENKECGNIDWANLGYLFGKCADTIHNTCDTLVTVGIGIIKYNSANYEGNKVSDEYLKELTGLEGAYLDFYSTHYYDWQRSYFGFPFDKSPEDFGLVYDKPCVIGETSNDKAEAYGISLPDLYKSTCDNGWNGLLVWMEPREDEEQMWYCYDLTSEATNSMADYIKDRIYPIGKKR